MGLIRFFKGLTDFNIVAEDVLALQKSLYCKHESNHPELDPHQILYQLWRTRFTQIRSAVKLLTGIQTHKITDDFGMLQTSLLASLPYPKNVRCLGLYILRIEDPRDFNSIKYLKYSIELKKIVNEINELIENKKIFQYYQELNPNSSTEFLELVLADH